MDFTELSMWLWSYSYIFSLNLKKRRRKLQCAPWRLVQIRSQWVAQGAISSSVTYPLFPKGSSLLLSDNSSYWRGSVAFWRPLVGQKSSPAFVFIIYSWYEYYCRFYKAVYLAACCFRSCLRPQWGYQHLLLGRCGQFQVGDSPATCPWRG